MEGLFGENGLNATVNVATDLETTLYLSLGIFLGIVAALFVYKRVF